MGSNQQNHGNLDYDVSVLLQKHKESGDIVLEISLQRHFLRGFIELIAPPALLVMVSWVKNNKHQHEYIYFAAVSKRIKIALSKYVLVHKLSD